MPANSDPDDLSTLPPDPEPRDLERIYQDCRAKLVSANRSRSSLKGHDARRGALLAQLQQQLNQLEVSLQEEAVSRLRVHELNACVAELVRDLEEGLDQAAAIVEEKGESGLTSWAIRIAKLLPIALHLRKVKSSALRLLGRASIDEESLPLPAQAITSPPEAQDQANDLEKASPLVLTQMEVFSTPPKSSPRPETTQAPHRGIHDHFGPLILKDLTDAYGLLVLYREGQAVPEGWCIERDSPWLPGEPLLALASAHDPTDAPVEAALEALSEGAGVLPELQPWVDAGILPFGRDERIRQLRLLSFDAIDAATHVLISQWHVSRFEEVEASPLDLDLDDGLWTGFALPYSEEKEVLRALVQRPSCVFSAGHSAARNSPSC